MFVRGLWFTLDYLASLDPEQIQAVIRGPERGLGGV